MLNEEALRALTQHGLSAHELQLLQDALNRTEGRPEQSVDALHPMDLLHQAALGGEPLACKLVSMEARHDILAQAAVAYRQLRQGQE